MPSWRSAGAPLALLGALSACTTQPPTPVAAPPVTDSEPATAEPLTSQPLKHLPRRNLKPMPIQPLTAQTECRFRDHTGYGGQLALRVKNTRVEQFSATVQIPQHGSCSFDLAQFEQTARDGSAVLSQRQSACTVQLWTQGAQLTVAFSNCPQQCSGDAFDYLWPILVDTRSGRCS